MNGKRVLRKFDLFFSRKIKGKQTLLNHKQIVVFPSSAVLFFFYCYYIYQDTTVSARCLRKNNAYKN